MQKIGDTTKTADSNGEFTDGDPQQQIPCTWLMAAWLNTVQREIIKVVEKGGLTLDPNDDTQLFQAIETLMGTAVGGLVKSVNTLTPDANGDVELTANDVGALPVYTNPLTVDLNTLGTPEQIGVYFQNVEANATVANHYPINSCGTLLVTHSAYGCQQEYTDFRYGRKFVRGLTNGWNGLNGPWRDWVEYYGPNNKPTADDVNAVKKTGDTMTGQLIAPSVATTPDAVPNGAGAYADQLSTQAPFFQPNWQCPVTTGGTFVPIAKGVSTRKDKGYPGAVSFGYLVPGNDEHPHPTIHVHGDSNVDCAWDFNPYTGKISSKAGTFATEEWVNAAVHTNELKVGNAQMAQDGNIWGTRWNPAGGWLWDAIVAQIQGIGQLSVSGTQWWAGINLNGGTLIVQGGYAEVRDAEVTDRIALNVAVPNRLLGVFITNKNFAQGYATYNPQVTVLDDNTGFNFVHGQKERMMYWIAVGY